MLQRTWHRIFEIESGPQGYRLNPRTTHIDKLKVIPSFYHLGEELLLCDTISLRAWQGQYVAAEANGAAMANRDSVGKKGRWKVVPKGDKIALKGVYGKHLAAESNGKANAKADNGPRLECVWGWGRGPLVPARDPAAALDGGSPEKRLRRSQF